MFSFLLGGLFVVFRVARAEKYSAGYVFLTELETLGIVGQVITLLP